MTPVRQWSGFQEAVTTAAFSHDGQLVAAGSLDRTIRVWSVETGEELVRLEGHEEAVYTLAFAPDGRLATGSMDRSIRLWDVRASTPQAQVLNGHRDYVLSVAITPDGEWLVSGSKDRSVQVWEPRQGVAHMILHGHRNSGMSHSDDGIAYHSP